MEKMKTLLKKRKREKKAVVWVSTVLYTLIAFAIIGTLLAVIRPKLAEIKDQFTIQQTISAFNDISTSIGDARKAAGNRRELELKLGKGEFAIYGNLDNSGGDRFEWLLRDAKYHYEVGTVESGVVTITTQERAGIYTMNITMIYSDLNLSVNGGDAVKILQPASTPYTITLENKGAKGTSQEGRGILNIDLTVD